MPKPTQLASLVIKEQRLYSELPPGDRAFHPISKGASNHPTEKAHFGCLHSGSCTFRYDTEVMNISKCWDKDQLINWELYSLAQLRLHHNRPSQRPQNSRHRSNLSVDLRRWSTQTHEQDPCWLTLAKLFANFYLLNFHIRCPMTCCSCCCYSKNTIDTLI